MTGRPRLEFYTRAGCHLCDEAKRVVAEVARRVAVEVAWIDVDSDAALAERFGSEVPVVLLDGRKVFKYRVDAASLERTIRDAASGGEGVS